MKDYPNQDALQAFADEPMPFHTLTGLVMETDNALRCREENVIYRYKPGYVRWESEDGDTRTVKKSDAESVEWETNWHDAVDVSMSEDYVCAHGFGCDNEMYECFWLLDCVLIENTDNRC